MKDEMQYFYRSWDRSGLIHISQEASRSTLDMLEITWIDGDRCSQIRWPKPLVSKDVGGEFSARRKDFPPIPLGLTQQERQLSCFFP